MIKEQNCNDLQEIITQALEQIKAEQGATFDIEKVNLAEMERITGISRARLRRLKGNGFVVKPHGRTGMKAERTVLSGYTGVIDDLLRKGITNASVCLGRIQELGYTGGLTSVKNYIAEHQDLVPPKRQMVSPQGNRGRRYTTGPGEAYQMDWGFTNVDTGVGTSYKAACFAMVCHHCGKSYIEFFPNAKQENLFIGMVHAFTCMGVPQFVLTDNMKSVVTCRDAQGQPVWNNEYAAFMKTVGFETKLCKPRHPFTKGKVERLVRYVKDNFLAGRVFTTITDLNIEAIRWCNTQNTRYHRSLDCVPNDKHADSCMQVATELRKTLAVTFYLCPERRISFDGFVHYEGRRFGVPYWYTEKTCRIRRDGFILQVLDSGLNRVLTEHDVTWSHRDSFCRDQYVTEQPEELPTMPVRTRIYQIEPPEQRTGFEKFNFEEGLWNE